MPKHRIPRVIEGQATEDLFPDFSFHEICGDDFLITDSAGRALLEMAKTKETPVFQAIQRRLIGC